MKKYIALLVLSAITIVGRAQDTITWDWTYTYGAGEADFGSGTFTTSDALYTSPISGNTGYLVTNIDGLFDGVAPIVELGTPGDTYGTNFEADNLIIPGAGDTFTLDQNGVAFYVTYETGEYGDSYGSYDGYSDGIFKGPDGPTPFSEGTLTIAEVTPEPQTLALAGLGLAGLMTFRRKK